MTPVASGLLRAPQSWLDEPLAEFRGRKTSFRRLVASALCFETTAILQLAQQTSSELIRSTRPGVVSLDHSGLLVWPADIVWLEWKTGDGFYWVLSFLEGDEYRVWCGSAPAEGVWTADGILEAVVRPQPEERFIVAPVTGRADATDDERYAAGLAGSIAVGQLMAINMPRGLIRRTAPPHRGLQKSVRRRFQGLNLRPFHVIEIDTKAGNVASTGARHQSAKALHYCRAHPRRIANGRTIPVRGHFRGDPALGVCRADYRVRP